MEKVCPRCRESFVCRNDQIEECWCFTEPLSSGFRSFLADKFQDCLCVGCIAGLRRNFIIYEQQFNLENEKKQAIWNGTSCEFVTF